MIDNNLSNKDIHRIIVFLDENDNACEEKDATHGRFLTIDSQGNRIEEGIFICNSNYNVKENKDDEVKKLKEEPPKIKESECIKIDDFTTEKHYYYDADNNICDKNEAVYKYVEIYKFGMLIKNYSVKLNLNDNSDNHGLVK